MDASATGEGAFIDFNNDFVCHKVWTENESLQSSTWRELSVIEFSLQSFATLLEGSHVKWYTDSQAAAKVVEVGIALYEVSGCRWYSCCTFLAIGSLLAVN